MNALPEQPADWIEEPQAAAVDDHLEAQYEQRSEVDEPYEPTDDFFPDDDVFFDGSFD